MKTLLTDSRFTQDSFCRLLLASCVTVLAASPARAQTSDARAPDMLEEIVVTAQKREERLSETPLSISALGAADLQRLNATQFRDFATALPSLSFTSNGPGETQVNIRGVTTGMNVAPTVGIYVDDVPYGSSTAFAGAAQLSLDVGLFDISRIELLRGPQGTLYGASTMGGLLKYVTKVPDPQTFSGEAQAGVSSTAQGGIGYNAAGALNLPFLDDRAAARVSAFYSQDAGYIDDIGLHRDDVNEAEIYGGRADVLLLPTEALSIRLSGFAQDISRDGVAAGDYDLLTSRPVNGRLIQDRASPEGFEQQFRLGSATVDYDFGPVKLTSISSFQKTQSYSQADYSQLYVPLLPGLNLSAVNLEKNFETEKFTQEVRLDATGTLLDWQLGGFYTRERSHQDQGGTLYNADGSLFPLSLIDAAFPSRFRESAAFGNITLHLTSQLDLIGGLRYSSNEQSYHQSANPALITVATLDGRSSEDTLTYLASARYKFSDRVMTYVRFATGYRPGGPNLVATDLQGNPLGPPTFQDDTLKSYEAGIKAETADRGFAIDANIYRIDWDDMQVFNVSSGLGGLTNAGAASIWGSEVTLTARPNAALIVTAALGYTNAELSEDSTDLGGLDGDPLPNTPELTAALTGDYSFDLANQPVSLGATVRYVDERVASFDTNVGLPQYRLPEYTTVDLRGSIEIGAVTTQLYVRNLLDERGQVSATTALSSLGGPAQVTILQPRTIGVSITTRF